MGQESNRFVEKLKMRMLHGSNAGKGVGVASVEPEQRWGENIYGTYEAPGLTRACKFGCRAREELSSLQDQVFLRDKFACSNISTYQFEDI